MVSGAGGPEAASVCGANVTDRRRVKVMNVHWSVFYSFLFEAVDYCFWVFAPFMPSVHEKLLLADNEH